jgi:hypothetical protein
MKDILGSESFIYRINLFVASLNVTTYFEIRIII